MNHSATSIVEFFEAHVPREFQRLATEVLVRCYALANVRSDEEFDAPEAHDYRPGLRRVLIERELAKLTLRTSGGTADPCQNRAQNCFHRAFRFGPVCFTASLVDRWRNKVRPADFRDLYAASNQLMLFDDMAPAPSAEVYAILEHEPAYKQPGRLGHASFIFPSCDGEIFVRISLNKSFPDLFLDQAEAPSFDRAPTEVIADEQVIVLRSQGRVQ